MYNITSIKKLLALFDASKAHYSRMNADDIKLCISRGNRKIGRVMNVSLPPVITCHNCKECKHFCYDIKACLQYPGTVIDARIRNYMVLLKDRDAYFSRIDAAISRRRTNKFFRWHVAGDIYDADYFRRMCEIAAAHPDFVFWTYTKNYTVVNDYCDANGRAAVPSNFHIMFSEWDGMPLINPYNFPVFTVKMKAGNINHPDAAYFAHMWKCPGNCDVCKAACRGCLAGENTYCDEH